ncbi:MAG: IS66 family insertion sequence element accessory protein TnpA [Bacillota bacterium]
MATRDLNLEREWKIKFEVYKNSGLSVKAWCEKNGIKPTTFHYWIKRFNVLEKEVTPVKTQFAKIVLESDYTNNKVINTTCESKKDDVTKQMPIQFSDFQVYFNNIRLTVPSDFNPVALAGLMKILRTL